MLMHIYFNEETKYKAEFIFEDTVSGHMFFKYIRGLINNEHKINNERLIGKITGIIAVYMIKNIDDFDEFSLKYNKTSEEVKEILGINQDTLIERMFPFIRIEINELEIDINDNHNYNKEKTYSKLFNDIKTYLFTYLKKSTNYIAGNL